MEKDYRPKILLVEDDMIIAADVSVQLSKLGYEVTGIHTRAEDALKTMEDNCPDIVLMDIMLGGEMNGIEAAKLILERHQTPVIFLTSNTDDATFQRALAARPYAFIAKPFQVTEMERSLKLTWQRIAAEERTSPPAAQPDHLSTMEDRLFIRHKGEMVKVGVKDILFMEADRSYCKMYLTDREYLLSVPLRNTVAHLPTDRFVQVHRSFVVNLYQIDAIGERQEYLTLGSHQVPISRRMREEVAKRLKMI